MNVLNLILVVIPIVVSQNDRVNIAGRKFTMAFFPEYTQPPTSDLKNFLYMSSTEAGSCTVSYNDGTRKTSVVNLIPGQVVEKPLPDNTQMSNIGTGVESKAIYINCTAQVTLLGHNIRGNTDVAEPFILLPDYLLSDQYIVSSVNQTAFIGIAAVHPDTHVSINIRSTCSYSYKQKTYNSGDVLNVSLNYGDVFRLGGTTEGDRDTCDFEGTLVSSDEPVSAFSGALYYRAPDNSNGYGPLVRQLLPESEFSRTMIVPSVKASTTRAMVIRVISIQNDTSVNITSEIQTNGHLITKFRILNHLEQFQMTFAPDINVIIHSTAPVMVTQSIFHLKGGSLVTIPGINQYGNNYIVRGFNAYETVVPDVTVVAESKSINNLKVNGHSPKDVKWTQLSTMPYSVGRFQIGDKGTYNISCSTPILVRVDEEVNLQSFSYMAGFTIQSPFTKGVIKSAVQLMCHEGGWDVRVDVDKLHLSNSDIPHLYLTTDTCTGTLDRGQLLFNYSYNDCNTQTTTIRGMMVYRNNLVLTSSSPQSAIVEYIWNLDLKCSMPTNNSGTVQLHPGLHGNGAGEIAATITETPVHVELYKDNEYRQKLHGPVIQIDVGQPVYVQVSTNNQNTVMLVNSCDAHLEEDKHTSLPLIENGCAINPRTKHLISRNQVTRFMFEVFEMKNDNNGIYVTCHVTFCDPMDFSDKCQQGCKTSPHGAIIGK